MTPNFFFNKLKEFISTEKAFFTNVSFVFGGRLYSALLSLALTPVIARLFTPEDYGEYGLFNTVVQNLAIIGTVSLPLAISTAKKSELNKIFHLTTSLILIFTILVGIVLYLLNNNLDILFSTNIFSKYWILALLGFALTAFVTTLHAVNIRLQQFKTNTKLGVIEASSTKIINLVGGWQGLNSLGLILSDVISKAISLILLLKKLPQEVNFSLVTFSKIYGLLKQFKQFPLYVMPSQWIGMLNNQFLIIIVALLFSKNELGQLVMAIGLLGIPLHVLTNTFQPVITERLSSLRGKAESKPFFIKTALLLLLISSVLFTTILILPPVTFTFMLGDKWDGIKPIINVIAIYYIVFLVNQSFENGFIVLNKQKAILSFSLIEWVLQITGIMITYILQFSFLEVIIVIAVVRSLISLVRVFYLWQKLKIIY